MDPRHRSDLELLSDVTKLVGSHRELTAKLVAHLAEIEERRLHLLAGFPSMFAFCVKQLALSEGEAFRRILAARLGRRFPIVFSLLAAGAVNLSGLELLRERLTEENHAELLEAVSGKTKREIEELLAARFPRPDVPSRIRKLPASPVATGSVEPLPSSPADLEPLAGATVRTPSRARIEPLSEGRFRVEFTAAAELREKLELCRDLLSHANPSRDLGVVIERAVDLLLRALESKRLARTKRARSVPVSEGGETGGVTRAVRRRVFERDGLRCTYVSADGRRCETRALLELDHVEPRALGGGNEPENLRVRCQAHNQLWAEQVFGRERVARLRWQKCACAAVARHAGERDGEPAWLASSPAGQKVFLALKGMGFGVAEARRAIAEVEKMHAETSPPSVEQALREAILVATARAA